MRLPRDLALLALGLTAALAAAPAATAGVILNTHNRSVEAEITNMVISDNESFTAPDANPFNQTATAQIDFQNTTSTMTATQNSSFGVAGGTTLTANVVSSAISDTEIVPGGLTSADSTFELDFSLDAPGTFTLTGTAAVSGAFPDPGFYAGYVIYLNGPGGIVFNFNDDFLMPGVNNQVFAQGGALAAGNYQLIFRAVVGGSGNVDERADINLNFIVNSPAGNPGNPGNPLIPLPAALPLGALLGAYAVNKASPRCRRHRW